MSHLTVRINDKTLFYVGIVRSHFNIGQGTRDHAWYSSLRLWKTAVTKKRKGKNAVTDTSGLKGTSLILSACSCLCRARRLRYFILYDAISVLCLCHFHNLALREASKLTVARIRDSISYSQSPQFFNTVIYSLVIKME